MKTFITFITTPCERASGNERITVPWGLGRCNRQEKVVAKVETRALTEKQAEAQALAKAEKIVRDGFGQIITDAEITVWTIRKFSVEV